MAGLFAFAGELGVRKTQLAHGSARSMQGVGLGHNITAILEMKRSAE